MPMEHTTRANFCTCLGKGFAKGKVIIYCGYFQTIF